MNFVFQYEKRNTGLKWSARVRTCRRKDYKIYKNGKGHHSNVETGDMSLADWAQRCLLRCCARCSSARVTILLIPEWNFFSSSSESER